MTIRSDNINSVSTKTKSAYSLKKDPIIHGLIYSAKCITITDQSLLKLHNHMILNELNN